MTITREALETIRVHAEKGYPYEICGLLVGTLVDDVRQVRAAWPVENAWEGDPQERERLLEALETGSQAKSAEEWDAHGEERRFLVSPRDVHSAFRRAREVKLDLLGVYHTHPNHPAIPSGFDRDAATPGWSYIIASVIDGKVAACRSWELEETGEQFLEEEVRILD